MSFHRQSKVANRAVDGAHHAYGQASIESTGRAPFKLPLNTASGRPIWAEQHRPHNALVLANPAPAT